MKKIYLLILLVVAGSWLQAQTWTGNSSTDWNNTANWSTAAIPTGTDNVIIPGSVASNRWPVFASNVTINSINMQSGSQLDVNGFTLTLNGASTYIYFTGATLNNSNGATDIVINVNTGVGGWATYFKNNTINDAIIFNLTGANQFYEDDGGTPNQYNGNASYNINDVLSVYISQVVPSQFNNNLTVNRTVAGPTTLFNAGGTVTGNYSFTNNAGGNIAMGNAGIKTNITGTVNIACNYPAPASFDMYRLENQTTGGVINIQNSKGFYLQKDTLKVTSLSITGYTGLGYGYFFNNAITGNVTIADDASYTGGFATYIRNNVITGTTIFSNNGTNQFYDADGAGTSNNYIGDVTYNGAGGPLYIAYADALQCSGNLTISRTVAGHTQAFATGNSTITGNFIYTNNTAGITIFGNAAAKTSINGTVNITANYATPNTFQVLRLINQTAGGSINVLNSQGFDLQKDTLKVTSLNITGYRGSAYGYFFNNDITGNVTIADDASYTGGFVTYLRNNVITGNAIFSNNGANQFYDADGGGTGNSYIGDVTYNGAGGPLYIAYADALQCSGNLTINRTVAGHTQAFATGNSTITGNFNYTNNTAGNTIFGNISAKTSIAGTVNIAANYATPNNFELLRIINQTGGGTINVQNSQGFNIQKDTLIVSSISLTGYRGSQYAYFYNNAITGNVTTADDASYTGGFASYFRNNIITGNTSIANNGSNILYDAEGAGLTNKYIGNITYTRTGGSITIGAGDITEISQNLTLNSTSGITLGKIKFNGSTNGIIEQLGTQPIVIPELTMAKTGAGKITLNDPVTVATTLTFNGGNIFSSTTNDLVFSDNATHTGSSATSHVDGSVTKTGNDAFTFPVGKTIGLAPISISAPAVATDAFRAQYFSQPPHNAGYDSTQKDPALNHLSRREYWMLDRTAGTSNVFVTLSWDYPRSGVVNSMADLKVARWNGSMWKDEGSAGTTGTNTTGTVQSIGAVNSFSPFTLASATPLNPLPVNLVSFVASKCSSGVCLLWVTENEQNFSHYEAEKSTDGITFSSFNTVTARNSGGRGSYNSTDILPVNGANYYRLKIVNLDGSFKYSYIIKVDLKKPELVSLLPNPATDAIIIKGLTGYRQIRVIDMAGKIRQQKNVQASIEDLNISHLSAGIYFVQLINDKEITTIKLVKQ